MKFDKALIDMAMMYEPIWEHKQWDINNITRIIIILYHKCYPDLITGELKDKVIYKYYYEVIDTDEICNNYKCKE